MVFNNDVNWEYLKLHFSKINLKLQGVLPITFNNNNYQIKLVGLASLDISLILNFVNTTFYKHIH